MSPEGFVPSSEQIERLNKWIKTEGGVAPFKRTESADHSGIIKSVGDFIDLVHNTTQKVDVDIYVVKNDPLIVCGYRGITDHGNSRTIYCGDRLAKKLEKAKIAVFPKPQRNLSGLA